MTLRTSAGKQHMFHHPKKAIIDHPYLIILTYLHICIHLPLTYLYKSAKKKEP